MTLAWLREADWLTGARARAYTRLLAAALAIALAYGLHRAHQTYAAAAAGRPIANDFVVLYAASTLALQGHAADAYNFATLNQLEHQTAWFESQGANRFFYPPIYLLLGLPLALLPYTPALLLFLTTTYATLLALLRRALPKPIPLLAVAAAPAMLVNGINGQNGYLSALSFVAAMVWLDTRPALAGAALGMLAFKPQLALLIPLALLAASRWAALAACAATALTLTLLSVLLFGIQPWQGFFSQTPLARAALEQIPANWAKIQSLFATTRMLGGSIPLAYAIQAAAALAATTALWRTARRRPNGRTLIAVLVAATLTTTPYLLDYDLVCLAIPMLWLLAEAQRTAWRPWEKTLLLVLYVAPLVARPMALAWGVPFLSIFTTIFPWVIASRSPKPDKSRQASLAASPST